MVNYENFYPGNYSSLDPEYGELFTGYKIPAGQLGATTSVQTANQLKEVTNLLNQGMKVVEVSTIQPEVFEMIPKQHLKEINRLTKLTGTETTLHAPTVDPSGFTQQGWSEPNREIAEKQFTEVAERAHELNPEGNIPVTIHASSVPGTEFIPFDAVEGLTEEEKKRWEKYGGVPQRMVVVNQETGEFAPLVREKRFYPEEEKIYDTEEELRMINNSDWINKITNLAFYNKEAGDLTDVKAALGPLILEANAGKKILKEDILANQVAFEKLGKAELFLDNVESSFRSLYNRAYKYGDEKTKEALNDISNDWKKQAKKMEKKSEEIKKIKDDEIKNIKYADFVLSKSQLINMTMEKLKQMQTKAPQIYKPVEEFTQEKASETLSNVAFNNYNKFGNSAPIVSIENPPYGSALAGAKDLKNLIEITRQKFIEKAKRRGISESQARKAAEKLIGVTWDTSHISMMRKQGFEKEELIKQAKTIAPYVKHVHLNDHLGGGAHVDLPPGMGSAPIKEIMQELEKAGYKGKKIFEGGAFFQHFQTSPHPYVLEAFGQASSAYGNYFAGYGAVLPEQHFSMYGGGFSGLPQELGGQIPGKQSRMSGAPMQ